MDVMRRYDGDEVEWLNCSICGDFVTNFQGLRGAIKSAVLKPPSFPRVALIVIHKPVEPNKKRLRNNLSKLPIAGVQASPASKACTPACNLTVQVVQYISCVFLSLYPVQYLELQIPKTEGTEEVNQHCWQKT